MTNFDKFTQKNQEALQRAVELATALEHQQIEPEHLLYALLKEEGGIISTILSRAGVEPGTLLAKLEKELEKKPRVHGAGQPFLSSDLNKVITQAQKIASEMKDEYIAQEHILLAILKENGIINRELKSHGITGEDVSKIIQQMRSEEH